MPRALLDDPALSFRAVGVGAWLLSKPEGWRVNSEALARTHAEGRDAVRSALRELELAGYLVRRKYQNPKTGRWWTETVLYESPEAAAAEADDPAPADGATEDGFPVVGPATGEPTPGKPTVGEPAVGSGDAKSLLEREIPPKPPEEEQAPPPQSGAPDVATQRNSRGNGTNLRAVGTNGRARGINPRGRKNPDPPTEAERTGAAAAALQADGNRQIAEMRDIPRAGPAVVADALAQARAVLVPPLRSKGQTEEVG